jgi:peptidoglycan lytic transglycosylase
MRSSMFNPQLKLILAGMVLVSFIGCTKAAIKSSETRVSTPGGPATKTVDKKKIRGDKPDKMASLKDRPYAVDGRWYFPLNSVEGYREQGIASWYGTDFHGKKTSSGETYDMFGPTAAHRLLPLNTQVRVRNPANNKEIIVRINDRGPFVKERIIDLSYDSAKALGLIGPGTALVELEAMGVLMEEEEDGRKTTRLIQEINYQQGPFVVQIGAFKEIENANRLKERLLADYLEVEVLETLIKGERFYRVRINCREQLNEALRIQKELENKGFTQVLVMAQ